MEQSFITLVIIVTIGLFFIKLVVAPVLKSSERKRSIHFDSSPEKKLLECTNGVRLSQMTNSLQVLVEFPDGSVMVDAASLECRSGPEIVELHTTKDKYIPNTFSGRTASGEVFFGTSGGNFYPGRTTEKENGHAHVALFAKRVNNPTDEKQWVPLFNHEAFRNDPKLVHPPGKDFVLDLRFYPNRHERLEISNFVKAVGGKVIISKVGFR